jgi:hypothetical protein
VVGLMGWSEDADELGKPKVRVAKRAVPLVPELSDELIAWDKFARIESGSLYRTRGGKVPSQSIGSAHWVERRRPQARVT